MATRSRPSSPRSFHPSAADGPVYFGARLSRLRKAAGMSARDLGSRTGISHSYLSRLERERSANPTLDTMLALQRAFGLGSLDELLGPMPSQLHQRLRDIRASTATDSPSQGPGDFSDDEPV